MARSILFLFQQSGYKIPHLTKKFLRKINIAMILIFPFSDRCLSQGMPRINFSEQEGKVLVEGCDGYLLHLLSGRKVTNGQWHNLLAVYVANKKTGKPQHNIPMLGQYAIVGQHIVFNPRFPFKSGVDYLARFNVPYFYALLERDIPSQDWQKIIELTFNSKPGPAVIPAVVDKVHPVSDTLPVNQLKLYIHFSKPMQEGMAYDHLQVLDENGKPVDQPFLELSPELWDFESKRLTVWFDPGRIKRGLSPNALKGLPLKQGNSYTLKIIPGWKDKTGHPLEATFEKQFYTSAPDRKAPVISNWILHIPARLGKAAISIQFDEPMDVALLNRMVRITSGEKPLTGRANVTDQGTTWTFEPQMPWDNTNYQIRINTKIEDLAGNSLRRLFDTPINTPGQAPEKEKELIIPVKMSPKAKNKRVRKYKFRTLAN